MGMHPLAGVSHTTTGARAGAGQLCSLRTLTIHVKKPQAWFVMRWSGYQLHRHKTLVPRSARACVYMKAVCSSLEGVSPVSERAPPAQVAHRYAYPLAAYQPVTATFHEPTNLVYLLHCIPHFARAPVYLTCPPAVVPEAVPSPLQDTKNQSPPKSEPFPCQPQ